MVPGRDLDRGNLPPVSWEGQEEEGQNLREGRWRSGMPWKEARKRGPTGRGLRHGDGGRRGVARAVAGAHGVKVWYI
jgi:hypothetical protein